MIFGPFSSPYNDKKNQIQITIFFALGIIQNYEILKKKEVISVRLSLPWHYEYPDDLWVEAKMK